MASVAPKIAKDVTEVSNLQDYVFLQLCLVSKCFFFNWYFLLFGSS